MVRFFINKTEMASETVILYGDHVSHAKVLRLKPGEEILVCDGISEECRCRVDQLGPDSLLLSILERRPISSEASVHVSIYMAFPKLDKLEHVIQKATELGADEIVTFPTARCVSKPDEKALLKKLERWKKIAASAAEQSGRGKIPTVHFLKSYRDALCRARTADLPILFYENEKSTTLRMALEKGNYQSVSLLTGPEGGLEEAEVALAKEHGFQVCTLGRRILRCETAPLCGLSAVMYAAGEF